MWVVVYRCFSRTEKGVRENRNAAADNSLEGSRLLLIRTHTITFLHPLTQISLHPIQRPPWSATITGGSITPSVGHLSLPRGNTVTHTPVTHIAEVFYFRWFIWKIHTLFFTLSKARMNSIP